MEILLRTQDRITVVHLQGRWDASSAPDIDAAITPHIGPGCRMVLELSGVNYMSSAGLRTLLLLYRSAHEQQGHVVLACVPESLQDVMSITGFLDYFELYPDLPTALDELRL